MKLTTTRRIATIVAALATLSAASGYAYVTFGKWGTNSVPFYMNAQIYDVTPDAAEAAVKVGFNAWNNAGSPFRYQYAGRTNVSSATYDSQNVVMFRNASNGSSIATTYWWTSNATGHILDTDIVFWDGAYKLYTGTSGCSSGVYIEDVVTHELGHALGLKHSSVTDATMYATYNLCTQSGRTLATDDIGGIKALYGTGSTPTNTAPAVSISTPFNNTSVVEGTAISFSGSAFDQEDGNITSRLAWSSNLSGSIGTGGAFTRTLAPGVHTVKATATDNAGATVASQITVTVTAATSAVTAPSPTPISLSVSTYKKKGWVKADLRWTKTAAAKVDVYRNGVRTFDTANTGAYTDGLNTKGSGTVSYRICEAGGTAVCSPTISASY